MQFDVKVDAMVREGIFNSKILKLPKIAMGHNIVLLKGVTAIGFGQKALGVGANVQPLPDSVKLMRSHGQNY